VVPGTEGHGVTGQALLLARATGAALVTDPADLADGAALHVHVTDRLFGAGPEEAAEVLVALAARTRLTVTLHDVPQPTDGASFERRRRCYSAVLDAAEGWVVNSRTEQGTIHAHCAPDHPGLVVPLAVRAPDPARARPTGGPVEPGDATLGVFGWIYPGKGHAEAVAAAALLGSTPQTRPRVLAVGTAAPGHDDLVDDLHARARAAGVRFTATGWLDDDAVDDALAAVDVAFAAHGNVSASGSLNNWLSAGRRPLVPAGAYAREMAALRPGTLELYPVDADAAQVADRIAARLADPALGAVAHDVVVRPLLPEVAAAYLRWWQR
jgi:glycosyltransferase involved in cell wall biosynthesis